MRAGLTLLAPVTESQGYGYGMPSRNKFSKCAVTNFNGRKSQTYKPNFEIYARFHCSYLHYFSVARLPEPSRDSSRDPRLSLDLIGRA